MIRRFEILNERDISRDQQYVSLKKKKLGSRGTELYMWSLSLSNLRPLCRGASLILQLIKNLAANAGDPSSIPGSGRSSGEGIGYPLQYSWASVVTQLIKNPPAMQDTWVRSLGWKDPLEKGKATHSSILTWRTPWAV